MNQFAKKFVKTMLSAAIAMQAPFAGAMTQAETQNVVNDVSAQLKRLAGAKAAFCFAVEDGAVTGYNENEPVRTASVTKTMTTFWAVERLGPNFQYTTHIFYQPSTHEMHIQGQRDPFFDRDRLFALLADLNRKGVTQINRLTVDSNFWFWPDATELRYFGGGGGGGGGGRRAGHAARGSKGGKASKAHGGGHSKGSGKHRRHAFYLPTPPANSEPTRMPASYSLGNKAFKHFVESEAHTDQTVAGDMEKVISNLKSGMNTSGWSASLKSRYQRARSMNPSLSLPAEVKMATSVVDLVPSNPLKGKPNVYEFVVKSAPMKMYLKLMNIWSINPYAEEIFFSLGGKQWFGPYMQQNFGFGKEVSNINTGSGVNHHGKTRDDSTISCSSVVRMIRHMDEDLESKYHLDLSDVLAVPGKDGGTWGDPSKSLVVKTGTLINPTPAKNLAGVAETTSGEVYFGIFIDRKGGNRGNVQRALTAMRSNFKSVEAKESPYSFDPLGAYTHMALVPPQQAVAAAKPAAQKSWFAGLIQW